MPKQINSSYNEVRTPFSKMSFSPDVPSTALGPNEYNLGSNVETDVRGIRSVAGDEEILGLVTPGTPVYISSGFRQDTSPIPGVPANFWTIIATEAGAWYAARSYSWYDITPVNGVGTYAQGQNITEAWSGTVPFFNDAENPPMFWPEDTALRIPTTAATSGSGTATLTFAQQAPLSDIKILDNAGLFSYSSSEQLKVNQKITISGTITNSAQPITATLSGVKITGTAGQFSCTASVLVVGQSVKISGTAGGTGSITGYTDPSTYKIAATNGTTTFTLVTQFGQALTTTAGTPTGLTYTLGVGITGNGGQFTVPSTVLQKGQQVTVSGTVTNSTPTLSTINIVGTGGSFTCASTALQKGQTVAISGSFTNTDQTLSTVVITGTAGQFTCAAATLQVGQTFVISGTFGGTGSITGYLDPTTYYISATNGSTTFTLVNANGSALVTTAGTPTGLTYTVKAPSITGYADPTNYVISTTNGTTTFTLVNVDGTAITTTAGTPTGLTYTLAAPAIIGYSNPTTYYVIATNGSTTMTLGTTSTSTTGVTTLQGTPTGLTFTLEPPAITGYTNPTTYYIIKTNGFNQFTLSTTLGGTAITTIPGTPTGLTFIYQPFYVGEKIQVTGIVPINYQGTYTVTAATATTVSYALSGTWGNQTLAGTVGPEFPKLIMYSNQLPIGIKNITYVSQTEYQIEFDSAQTTAPYANGETIQIANVNDYFNGVFDVISCTTTKLNFFAPNGIGSVYPGNSVGTVAPQYSWNYNPQWSKVHAGWMRMYNTPNVGSILVAGNLTATNKTTGQIEEYPVTVQWSQNFGLNDAPLTWTPTITNVANQLEVPLRGASLDAFPSNGQLFLCSYWDTVVFSPINYTTTSAPILGVRLFNQGRGLLTSNCFVNTDKMIYGIDARDVWVFDGTQFTGLGNQRVKNWFFNQIDQNYVDRIYMQANTQRNQIEIYYPTVDAVNGVPNKMISYRYDIDCWNAPRDVSSATMTTESPIRYYNSTIGAWTYDGASRTVIYARGVANQKLVQKDQGYSFLNDANIDSYYQRDNIKLLQDYSGKLMVHRILPEFVNLSNAELPIDPGASYTTLTTTGTGSVATITFATQALRPFTIGDTIKVTGVTPNSYNGVYEVTAATTNSVSYAASATGSQTVAGTVATNLIGNLTTTLLGANSVGQAPVSVNSQTMTSNTDYPWLQYNQNAYRVNSIKMSNSSNKQIWMVNGITWQYTATEDDR